MRSGDKRDDNVPGSTQIGKSPATSFAPQAFTYSGTITRRYFSPHFDFGNTFI